MEFKKWLLAEMPMTNMQFIGNWDRDDPYGGMPHYNRPGVSGKSPRMGWHKDDFGILTHPTALAKNFGFRRTESGAVEKIPDVERWKCPQPFNALMVRTPAGARVREVGNVGLDYVQNTLQIPDANIMPNAINILFTNNLGAQRMPFFKWTAAHRVGHAIRGMAGYTRFMETVEKDMYSLLYQVYDYTKKSFSNYDDYYRQPRRSSHTFETNDKMLLSLANSIGTMKSAREKNIRNIGEFYHELTAQYIVEGKIRLKAELPRVLAMYYTWGRPQGRYSRVDPEEEGWHNYITDFMEPELNHYLSVALNECIGKIFVM